ncbi:MAG: MarR family winged helix-turn-helix transcriptional regulator [Thermodesulfobacteriota bacterium]
MKIAESREEIDEVLFRALRAVFQFERLKVALFGLTFEEIYLLQFLRRKSPSRVGDIAAEMKTPISTLSRTIGRLQKRGLVSRRQDSGDKRVILVSLPDKGRRMVMEVETHSFELITRNMEAFGRDDIQAFIQTADALEMILRPEPQEFMQSNGKDKRREREET